MAAAEPTDYEVEFVDRGETSARFLARGVTPAFANGIRRAMIADVPTMAIDTVRVIENSSVMFDEQIGLRLGLIPLTTPPGEFDLDDTVTLSMDVTGPATAYSGDLRTADDMVRPASEGIPIIDLKEGQRLELEADAVMDVGREHAKHQGGVSVGYRHLQQVEVVGDAEEFGDEEPHVLRGHIEYDGEVVAMEDYDNDLTKVPEFEGKELEVHDVENAFVFHVETDGSLTVEDLVLRAVDTIERRAEELEEAVAL